MNFQQAVRKAYTYELCIDFYSLTISDPEGNEWYWSGESGEDELKNFIDVMQEVVAEQLEKLED